MTIKLIDWLIDWPRGDTKIYLLVLKNNEMKLLQPLKTFNDGRDNWSNCWRKSQLIILNNREHPHLFHMSTPPLTPSKTLCTNFRQQSPLTDASLLKWSVLLFSTTTLICLQPTTTTTLTLFLQFLKGLCNLQLAQLFWAGYLNWHSKIKKLTDTHIHTHTQLNK